jgi:antitoxin VapB
LAYARVERDDAAGETVHERPQSGRAHSREFELPGDEAIMRKEGDRLIIEPSPRKSLLAVLGELEPLEDDFAEVPDPPPGDIEF